jgi:uncharacterized membrane protein YozB (DUF420 family)
MVESPLPAVNCTLNATSAVLLVAAYVCIKKRRIEAHATLILAACATSMAFLVCYLIYHATHEAKSVGLPRGPWKSAYLVMLASHVVLAVAMVPMILLALLQAYRRRWIAHRKIAAPTFWIWLYVSVTGVFVYWILYHLVPALYPVRQS